MGEDSAFGPNRLLEEPVFQPVCALAGALLAPGKVDLTVFNNAVKAVVESFLPQDIPPEQRHVDIQQWLDNAKFIIQLELPKEFTEMSGQAHLKYVWGSLPDVYLIAVIPERIVQAHQACWDQATQNVPKVILPEGLLTEGRRPQERWEQQYLVVSTLTRKQVREALNKEALQEAQSGSLGHGLHAHGGETDVGLVTLVLRHSPMETEVPESR